MGAGRPGACEALGPLLRDATLALTDAAFSEGRDVERGVHLSARRAAEAAVGAGGVERLMLTHLPPWTDVLAGRAQAAEVWPGEVEVAVAGSSYEL